MSNHVVLYRNIEDDPSERDICSRHVLTTTFRSAIAPGSVVIGRYSVLPYYAELEKELQSRGSRLINSWREHRFIADASEWGGPGGALEGMTPRTWRSDEWANLPEGSYVLKGRTNSRKTQWATHMFAATRADVPSVASRLYDDPFILQQGLIAREYIPLRKLDDGLNGLPITNEWRTFWLVVNGIPLMLCSGYYWASHPECAAAASFPKEANEVAHHAAVRIADHASFFALDMAETADGRWIVVEVNDGQMSGLSMCNPEELYANMADAIRLIAPPKSSSRHNDLP